MAGTIGGIGGNNLFAGLPISGNNSSGLENKIWEQKISSQSIDQVLEQLGLPDNIENQLLVKALLEYNLPLNKENFWELSRLLKQLGGDPEEIVSLLAYLKSKEIPLDKELVQMVKQFLGEKNLSNLLKDYPQWEKEGRDLAKLLKNLILDSEKLNSEEIAENLKKLAESKKEILQGKSWEHNLNPEQENVTQFWADFKGSMETENLLKYYQIPFLNQGKLSQATIKINPEEQGSTEDSKEGEARLVIFLETQNLGQVKIALTAQKKSLLFHFTVQEEEIKESLELKLPELTEKLEALGYQAQESYCSLEQEQAEKTYWEMEKKIFLSALKKIDLLI